MKTFNRSVVNTLVLASGILASHLALADSAGKANGGLMHQLQSSEYRVAVVNSSHAQQALKQVQIADVSGNGGLARVMLPTVNSPVSAQAMHHLNAIDLGDTSSEGNN